MKYTVGIIGWELHRDIVFLKIIQDILDFFYLF